MIADVGPTPLTVLILGERGTGKELVARALHAASPRRHRPFVPVNCADLSPELLASQLFGHERGAFTGAHERRLGKVRAAEGGTLFLDEIGDLAPEAQGKLLRFLQEREIEPVGLDHPVRVDVRVVAATNTDLERAMREGRFRADLRDRMVSVLPVPPLRERREDIPLLVEHLLARWAHQLQVAPPRLSLQAFRAIQAADWPANVRGLENAIAQAIASAREGWIRPEHLQLPAAEAPADPARGAGLDGSGPPRLTARQAEALRIATERGEVRRGDLRVRFGVSRETAHQDLVWLVGAGLLRRTGRGRGSRYRLARDRWIGPTPVENPAPTPGEDPAGGPA
jgi:DNA-binding NtrC family response regulator